MTALTLRAYGPLNDFLPSERRQSAFTLTVDGHPSIKDVVESAGIPHTDVALLLLDGCAAGFDARVDDGSRIAVYPAFMQLDAGALAPVHQPLPDPLQFVADVHLGKLARYLRLLGIDTAYDLAAEDSALAAQAESDNRVLLTRDVDLLKRRALVHGYFVRETRAERQLTEVLLKFTPPAVRPFARCMRCNGLLRDVPKSAIEHRLEPRTRQQYDEFRECERCGGLFWRGSHARRLDQLIADACSAADVRVDQ